MSFTTTPNYSLYKPTVNADNDQWGTHLNANADTLDSTLKTIASTFPDIGRNLIHNPLFNVAQRGAGPFTAGGLTADRWRVGFGSDTVSATVGGDITDAGRTAIGDESIRTFLNNTFTGNAAAGAFNFVSQSIEDVRRLAGKTITVSFWAAAGTALKLGVNIGQIFGTGGSPSAALNMNGVAVQLTTAWGPRYSVTFAVPSIVGKTLGTNGDSYTQLNFWFSCGATNATIAGNIGVQSGSVSVAGVQLEIGSVATPLEKPDPRYDLSNCQRFYQLGNFEFLTYQAAGSIAGYAFPFLVQFRTNPTVTPGTTTTVNCSAASVGAVSTNRLAIFTTATVAGAINLQGNFTASADL